ncbi:hypothetical protein ACOSP7_006782 [Xanthoceras sorbifolium]
MGAIKQVKDYVRELRRLERWNWLLLMRRALIPQKSRPTCEEHPLRPVAVEVSTPQSETDHHGTEELTVAGIVKGGSRVSLVDSGVEAQTAYKPGEASTFHGITGSGIYTGMRVRTYYSCRFSHDPSGPLIRKGTWKRRARASNDSRLIEMEDASSIKRVGSFNDDTVVMKKQKFLSVEFHLFEVAEAKHS